MAAEKGTNSAKGNDYPTHERNYSGFIRIFKIAALVTGVATLIVLLIIAN